MKTTKQFKQFNAKIKDLGEGIVEAIVATQSEDRHGEVLEIKGVDLKNYKNNPVVQWAHDYDRPPIAKSLSIRKTGDGKIISKMQFAIAESDFAHTIYKLYKGGYLNAFSIGFIPKEMDENRYVKSEMIEFSAVPVPANAEALQMAVAKGIDVDSVFMGVVPSDISREKQSEDLKWNAPNLEDFTDKDFDKLTEKQRRDIARHFAWAEMLPPDNYEQLKLPHHDAKSGEVNWKGTVSAMAVLLGARGGVDIPESEKEKVYNHLVSHYRQFDKDAPELKELSIAEIREYIHMSKKLSTAMEAILASYETDLAEGRKPKKKLIKVRKLNQINDRVIEQVTCELKERIKSYGN